MAPALPVKSRAFVAERTAWLYTDYCAELLTAAALSTTDEAGDGAG